MELGTITNGNNHFFLPFPDGTGIVGGHKGTIGGETNYIGGR